MKAANIMMAILFSFIVTACGGGTNSESDSAPNDMSAQEQAELVAAALSNDQGGIGDDIDIVSQAAAGDLQQQTQTPNAAYDYSISVNVDFYDVDNNPQDTYDPETTDQIDYTSEIKGEITNGTGYFSTLSIDNRAEFSVDEILSRSVWINGTHTNRSSYERTEFITQAEVQFQLDCELIVTDIVVDLDASDTFPESGIIEGSLSGSYERTGAFGSQTHQFSFHFIATYMGDNTAEIELDDGTVYLVQLDNGTVENIE